MKTLTQRINAVLAVGLLATAGTLLNAQVPAETSSTTTVTSTGTVSEMGPSVISVRSTTSPTPVRYSFTKTTTYVDENGNPVSVQTVKSGAPVVVYYQKSGDGFVADKVVVKKSVTTTTDSPVPIASPTVAASTPPSIDGIVTDADSDEISIRSATSDSRMNYKAHDNTAYVDENGNPVSLSSLKKGTPVTIFYERDGDDLRATRVVVKNSIPVQSTTTRTETTVPQ